MVVRTSLAALCAASVVLLSTAARAQEPPPRQPLLSVGAGVALSGYFSNPILRSSNVLALQGMGGGSSLSPRATGLVEIAQSRRFRWVVGVDGGYQVHDRTGDEANSYLGGTAESSASAGARLGARWISHPGAAVQASPIATAGAGWVHADGIRTGSYAGDNDEQVPLFGEATGFVATLRLGVVFEYLLLDQLYLRFDNQVLQAQYGRVEESEDTSDGPREHRVISVHGVGLAWIPSLQLRMEL